jgi:hypothetical protein
MEFVDHDERRLRDPHTDANADPNSISDGHTSDADTDTYADPESGDNTYATATLTDADPESGDNTYATTIHTHADPEPDTITNTDCRGAGRQPVDEDERADRR